MEVMSSKQEASVWQWQADADPYKETDPSKWIWQSYSNDVCRILENAFRLKQDLVDLPGDYEIDLKKMVQVNKKSKDKVRRIQRQVLHYDDQYQSRFKAEIPEPVVVAQKSLSAAFGTVQHFLDYIMKKTPESYMLYQDLKKLSLDSESWRFKKIIEEVVVCLKKGAEVREKIVKGRSGAKMDNLKHAGQMENEIRNNSKTLRDFLRVVLKIYTMQSFVCYWLNEMLRNEDWEEINVLTPYLVCLIYTFKVSDYTIKHETGGILNTMLGYVMKQKLYLYRGAALTKDQLTQYDQTKVNHFSWNSVTSASRSLEIAQIFADNGMEEAKQKNEEKVKVIFNIETDFASIEDCEGMIDAEPYSQFKYEKEIILAPGTVFQLGKVWQNKKGGYEINLKVKRKFKEAKEKIPLLGDLQNQAILEDKALLVGMPSADSLQLLKLLKGNKLIKKLEIKDSEIDESLVEKIEYMRMSTKLKKTDLEFINNKISISSLSTLIHYFSEEGWSNVCASNQIKFDAEKAVKEDWKIEKLILQKRVLEGFESKGHIKELCKGLKNERQLKAIKLLMKELEISPNAIQHIFGSIKQLASLEALMLTPAPIMVKASDVFFGLCKTLGSSKSLKYFYLDLDGHLEGSHPTNSLNFADLSVFNLSEGIRSLTRLKGLSLNFRQCKEITDESLKKIRPIATSLISLKKLSLNFAGCSKISDEGFYQVANMIAVGNLNHISLDFTSCNKISDEALNYLESVLELSARPLKYLSLQFWHCRNISDEGLNCIGKALAALRNLASLTLAFGGCNQISDQGLNNLGDVLSSLKSLKELSINLKECPKISMKELRKLKDSLEKNKINLSINNENCRDLDPPRNLSIEREESKTNLMESQDRWSRSEKRRSLKDELDEFVSFFKDIFSLFKDIFSFFAKINEDPRAGWYIIALIVLFFFYPKLPGAIMRSLHHLLR